MEIKVLDSIMHGALKPWKLDTTNYGKEDVVKKPHSFLNEAKKTAIGLAIRLGILER